VTTPHGIVGEFEEQGRPKGCLWVTQDHCRNPMRGTEDGCYKCLAGKVNKARIKAGDFSERWRKLAIDPIALKAQLDKLEAAAKDKKHRKAGQ
jgi:hypothetical protein